MKYNFNNQLVIHYDKNIYTKTYKRAINKTDSNKYNVITYYKEKGENRVFKSKLYFNEEQIEKIIDMYINDFKIKKRIEYKLGEIIWK